jgi:hypothetical protein
MPRHTRITRVGTPATGVVSAAAFGTNRRTAQTIGALEYTLETARQCGLVPEDISLPRAGNQRRPG